jgi:hypothetical protein
MHAYSQNSASVTMTYSIDHESTIDFRDSEVFLQTITEDASFKIDLDAELS